MAEIEVGLKQEVLNGLELNRISIPLGMFDGILSEQEMSDVSDSVIKVELSRFSNDIDQTVKQEELERKLSRKEFAISSDGNQYSIEEVDASDAPIKQTIDVASIDTKKLGKMAFEAYRIEYTFSDEAKRAALDPFMDKAEKASIMGDRTESSITSDDIGIAVGDKLNLADFDRMLGRIVKEQERSKDQPKVAETKAAKRILGNPFVLEDITVNPDEKILTQEEIAKANQDEKESVKPDEKSVESDEMEL